MPAHSIRQNPPTCSLVSANGPSESISWRRRTRTALPSAGGRKPPPPHSTPRDSIRSLHPPQPSSACAAALSSPRISNRYRTYPPYQTEPNRYDECPGRKSPLPALLLTACLLIAPRIAC